MKEPNTILRLRHEHRLLGLIYRDHWKTWGELLNESDLSNNALRDRLENLVKERVLITKNGVYEIDPEYKGFIDIEKDAWEISRELPSLKDWRLHMRKRRPHPSYPEEISILSLYIEDNRAFYRFLKKMAKGDPEVTEFLNDMTAKERIRY